MSIREKINIKVKGLHSTKQKFIQDSKEMLKWEDGAS